MPKSNTEERIFNQIIIVGEINDEIAKKTLEEIRTLELMGVENIDITLSTPGGEIGASLAIYDAIRLSKCQVSITAFGHCMSAGPLIMQAADIRSSGPNTRFMIHNGSTGMEGSIKALEQNFLEMQEMNDRFTEIMLSKSSLTHKKLVNLMNLETFFWPAEAKKLGFIDKVLTYPKKRVK